VLATCFLKWACKLKCLALSGYFQMPKGNNCRSETLYNLKVYVSLYCHRVLPTDTVGGARRQGPALSSNAWHSRQSRLFCLHLKGIEYVIRHSIRGHSQGTLSEFGDPPSLWTSSMSCKTSNLSNRALVMKDRNPGVLYLV
jgi:hypothetical protein